MFGTTLIKKVLNKLGLKICEERGCWCRNSHRFTLPSLNPARDKNVVFYYCYSHAKPNGFCPSCKNFGAGIESFDFSKSKYLCDECLEELEYDCDLQNYEIEWDEKQNFR